MIRYTLIGYPSFSSKHWTIDLFTIKMVIAFVHVRLIIGLDRSRANVLLIHCAVRLAIIDATVSIRAGANYDHGMPTSVY
jgi:hypothetical protein